MPSPPPSVVRTLDTNVVVRLLIGDALQQTPVAEQAFLEAIASGGVFLPDVVLADVGWVLRGYALDRITRHRLLERLVRTRGLWWRTSMRRSMRWRTSARGQT